MITFVVRLILIGCVPSLAFVTVRLVIVERRAARIRRECAANLRRAVAYDNVDAYLDSLLAKYRRLG